MPFVLRSEQDQDNPPLACVFGKQITAGLMAYYLKEGSRTKCIIFLGEGEMDGIDKLYYNGEIVSEFTDASQTIRNWKFHRGTRTTQPTFIDVTAISGDTLTLASNPYNITTEKEVAIVYGVDTTPTSLPTDVKDNQKMYVVYSSGNNIKLSLTDGGTPITWTSSAHLLTNLRVYRANAGFFDTEQGRPEFFDIDFTFSEIAYVEVWLNEIQSQIETDQPTKFKIFVRGKRLQNYDANGLLADEKGIAYPDQNNLPAQTKFFSANNALVAVDIIINSMKIDPSRINWASFVKYRDYCNEAIGWDSGATSITVAPSFTTVTNIQENPTGVFSKITDASDGSAVSVQSAPDSSEKMETSCIWNEGHLLFGLTKQATTSSTYSDYLYAIGVNSQFNVYALYRKGVNLFQSQTDAITRGDRLTVSIDATNVNFLKNGAIIQSYPKDMDTGNTNPVRNGFLLQGDSAGGNISGLTFYPATGTGRVINRFDANIVYPQQLDSISALEQVLGHSPSCNYQDVNGKVTFIVGPTYKNLLIGETATDGDRVLCHLLSFDTSSGVPSNIVADSVSLYKKPPDEKQNFARIGYRDITDEFYTQKYTYADRPDLRDYVDVLVDQGIVQLGVTTQSEADRFGESMLRYNTDLDLFVNVKGMADSFKIAKDDLVKFAHDIPNWSDAEAPVFVVVEETFDNDTADERTFTLQIYSDEFYSDTAHGKISGIFPASQPDILVAPLSMSYDYNGVTLKWYWDKSATTRIKKYRITDEFDRFIAETTDLFYVEINPSLDTMTRRVYTVDRNDTVSTNFATATFVKPFILEWTQPENVTINDDVDHTLTTTVTSGGLKYATLKTTVLYGEIDTVLEFSPSVNNVSQGICFDYLKFNLSPSYVGTYFNADGTFGITPGDNTFGTYNAGDRFIMMISGLTGTVHTYKVSPEGVRTELVRPFPRTFTGKGAAYVRAFTSSTSITTINLRPKLLGNLSESLESIPKAGQFITGTNATYDGTIGEAARTGGSSWGSSGVTIEKINGADSGIFYFSAFGSRVGVDGQGVAIGLGTSTGITDPNNLLFWITIDGSGAIKYYHLNTLLYTDTTPVSGSVGLSGGEGFQISKSGNAINVLIGTGGSGAAFNYTIPLADVGSDLWLTCCFNGSLPGGLTSWTVGGIGYAPPYVPIGTLTPEGDKVAVSTSIQNNTFVGENLAYDIPKFTITSPIAGQLLQYNSDLELVNIPLSAITSAISIGTAITGGVSNAVLYQNGSNNLATSSGLLFDGSKLTITSTTEQFRVAYDSTHYFNATVGSSGFTTFDGGTGSKFTFNKPLGINRIPSGSFEASGLVAGGSGTASQSGTTVTATTPIFNSNSVGNILTFANGVRRTILTFTDTTHVVVDTSGTVTSQAVTQTYAGFFVGSDGLVYIGSTTDHGQGSTLFVVSTPSTTSGGHIDVRGHTGGSTDNAIIELEGADYDSTIKSVYLEYMGGSSTGTTNGYSNADLALLSSAANNFLIRTVGASPIVFLPNFTEAGKFTGAGEFNLTPPVRTSGTTPYHKITAPADTGLTASTEAIGVSFVGATRQHATGALATQREYVFGAPTYSFAGASTITTAITADFANPVAGTNATITNAYSLRAANVLFTGKLALSNSQALQFKDSGGVARDSLQQFSDDNIYLDVQGNQAGTGGQLIIRTGASGTFERLRIDSSGNVVIAGLLKTGSGPTTLTDSVGKILSAALNTVQVGQGGTGLTSFTANYIPYATATNTLGTSINFQYDGTVITLTSNLAANTSGTGILLQNTTLASTGVSNQVRSPRLSLRGQGWKSNATAASQTVEFALETQPFEGTTQPSGQLAFTRSINGGTYTTVATLSTGGGFAVTGDISASGNFFVGGTFSAASYNYLVIQGWIGGGSSLTYNGAYAVTLNGNLTINDSLTVGTVGLNGIVYGTSANSVATSTDFLFDGSRVSLGAGTSPSAKIHVQATTEQLRVGYNSSNYYSTTVSSVGAVTHNLVGSGVSSVETLGGSYSITHSSPSSVNTLTMSGFDAEIVISELKIGRSSAPTTYITSTTGLIITSSLTDLRGFFRVSSDFGSYLEFSGSGSTAMQFKHFGGYIGGYLLSNAASTVVIQQAASPSTNAFAILNSGSTAITVIDQNGSLGVGITASLAAAIHVVRTTEQLRLGYDASNYYSTTIGSTGGVTFNAVGSGAGFTFSNPIGLGGATANSTDTVAITRTTSTSNATLFNATLNTTSTAITNIFKATLNQNNTGNVDAFAFDITANQNSATSNTGTMLGLRASANNIAGSSSSLQALQFSVGAVGTTPTATCMGGTLSLSSGTAVTNMFGGNFTFFNLGGTITSGKGISIELKSNGAAVTTAFMGLHFAHTLQAGTSSVGTSKGISFDGWAAATNITSDNYLIYADTSVIKGPTNHNWVLYSLPDMPSYHVGKFGIGTGTSTPSARLHVIDTTEQLRVGYDASNYFKITVGSSGTVTFDATGAGAGFVFNQTISSPSLTGMVVYQGDIDCSTNPNYPVAAAGWMFVVSVAGVIGGTGPRVSPGDAIIAKVATIGGNHAVDGAHWFILERHFSGAANRIAYTTAVDTIGTSTNLQFDGTKLGVGGTPSAGIHVTSTTEQLRVGYDTSNYYSTTVGSTGGVTFDAVGSGSLFTFSDPVVMRRKWRVFTATSTATLTPEINTYDVFHLTAQAAALTIANHSTSTPNDGDKMEIRILDDGTARAISFGTAYVAKAGVALPTTTTATKNMTLLFEWNANLSKWNLLASGVEV